MNRGETSEQSVYAHKQGFVLATGTVSLAGRAFWRTVRSSELPKGAPRQCYVSARQHNIGPGLGNPTGPKTCRKRQPNRRPSGIAP